jgi:hypothetical protein
MLTCWRTTRPIWIRAEIGRRGAAFTILMINGDAKRAVAVEFDVFHFTGSMNVSTQVAEQRKVLEQAIAQALELAKASTDSAEVAVLHRSGC